MFLLRSRMRGLLSGFVLGAGLAVASLAGLAAHDSLPSPTGYVNDFAGVIPTDLQQQMEQSLLAFEEQTTVEIAVVAVDNLGGDTIEGYAAHLFEAWGIGKKGDDNGILLLLSREDRRVKIEVGYGMEPYLTDGQAGRILDNDILPSLKTGDYGHGLLNGVNAITRAVVANGYEHGKARPSPGGFVMSPRFYIIIGLAFASMYVMAFMARTKEVVLGTLWGTGVGGVLGWLFGGLVAVLIGCGIAAVLGFLLDKALSSAYKYQVKSGRPTSWGSTWGGFSGVGRGGWGGGGFGGFGGGHSGGGGAGRGF